MPSLLLVKTSSLGDVVHALPVLTDLARSPQPWTVTWVVEEAFAALPLLHPLTTRVIPVAVRRWRHAPWAAHTRAEFALLRASLAETQADLVLDLQGLLKSALLCRLSPGERHGYDWNSAREPLASLFYGHRHRVSRQQHAVARNRLLTATALGSDAKLACDYGVRWCARSESATGAATALLLHASSRDDKLWPDVHWVALGRKLSALGLDCLLPAGNPAETRRAERLAQAIPGAQALTPGPLRDLLPYLAGARLAVGVDTGLTHLATAFGLPTVALFTATDPAATGVYGSARAVNLGGPNLCPAPEHVLATLEQLGAC